MENTHHLLVAKELNIRENQVSAAALLLDEGATVPFIARYRKEATGSLDEVAVTAIRDRLLQLRELDKRREAVLASLDERKLLTEELRTKIEAAESLVVLEDIYLPFRPKRKTRASVAKERGLEPLSEIVKKQEDSVFPETEAAEFVDAEKGVDTVEAALAGARDILAEWISEDQQAREAMRALFAGQAILRSNVIKGKEEEAIKYRDYFEWEEPASKAPSHRVLAIRRGEKEGFLSMRMIPPEVDAISLLEKIFVRGNNASSEQVRLALQDSYKRLLSMAMETELRLEIKKKADHEAIRVFTENIRQLLLAPPLGRKNVLAIDPGFRTGCKIVCLDRQGKLLQHDTIYPHFSDKGASEASLKISDLCRKFGIEAIAVGNGTAGRETEAFLRGIGLPQEIRIVMVNESGASIYSASEVAREEFPELDLTIRGSVSIGRRMMDPLAELVKIDPKSIGVGQYQHDIDQPALKASLDDVVTSCVNKVGVEVNTASRQLLTYVSGLGPQLAKGVIEYRNEHGPFKSREELKNIPRLGPKAFEQAAGFLRIHGAENPLDASAVHPESYHIVTEMAKDSGCRVPDLMKDTKIREKIDISRYVTPNVGLPTLTDIMSELAKPGRDPREEFETFSFAEGVEKLEDVHPGMKLPGIVTNITAFGVFVDIGVHQDGLVHISELADRYVRDPNEVVKVQQKVTVTVTAVDIQRKRIALSMKGTGAASTQPSGQEKKQAIPAEKKGRAQKKPEQKPARFSNNPFADALKKIR